MERAEGLAYDYSESDSMATVMGVDGLQGPALSLCDEAANCPLHTLRYATTRMPGLPVDHMPLLLAAIASGDAVELHVDEAELDNL